MVRALSRQSRKCCRADEQMWLPEEEIICRTLPARNLVGPVLSLVPHPWLSQKSSQTKRGRPLHVPPHSSTAQRVTPARRTVLHVQAERTEQTWRSSNSTRTHTRQPANEPKIATDLP